MMATSCTTHVLPVWHSILYLARGRSAQQPRSHEGEMVPTAVRYIFAIKLGNCVCNLLGGDVPCLQKSLNVLVNQNVKFGANTLQVIQLPLQRSSRCHEHEVARIILRQALPHLALPFSSRPASQLGMC